MRAGVNSSVLVRIVDGVQVRMRIGFKSGVGSVLGLGLGPGSEPAMCQNQRLSQSQEENRNPAFPVFPSLPIAALSCPQPPHTVGKFRDQTFHHPQARPASVFQPDPWGGDHRHQAVERT